MNTREHLEKLIPLYFYGELTNGERKELEVHLEYCERCRNLFKETKALHQILDNKIEFEPSENLLNQSRLLLRNRLREEQRAAMADIWWERFLDFLNTRSPQFQLVAATAILLVGLLLGRFIWAENILNPLLRSEMITNIDLDEINQPLINNIDLVKYDPVSGMVTVRYKSVSDVLLTGKIDDAPIRKILVHAIRTEEHPGRRLTAVKALSDYTFSDDEVEKALIYAVENDQVDGVRFRAAKVLKTLPINQSIKKAFIRVLLKDTNSAIRIEAVEALSKVKEEEDVVPIFQGASKGDENEFIRLQTTKELERRENPKLVQEENRPNM